MLTIITLEELTKLHRDKKLQKSENFEFLSQTTENFLTEVYKESKDAEIAKIIYVHSVDGKQVLEAEGDILEDANGTITSYLPQLESEQICIITKVSKGQMTFTDQTLDELDSTSLSTEEEKDFYKEILTEGASDDEGSCVYAVTESLKLDDVVRIIYPEELEEQIKTLKESDKTREVLFHKTNLFS